MKGDRFDVQALRSQCALFKTPAVDQAVCYLDSAATTQMPDFVIDAVMDVCRHYRAPVHRGLYGLASEASQLFETSRATLAQFIGAETPSQLVFTRSTTEAINMVAQGWAKKQLKPGDYVWVTRMEHHANFLPWQRVCRETGAELKIIELADDLTLDIDQAEELFSERSRLIAVCHESNVLGVVNPINEIIERAAEYEIPVFVDAAQSISHIPIDVESFGCDFLAFSAHKMFGPSGIGVLYAKTKYLENMEPLNLGGGMVDCVSDVDCDYSPIPARFEAGSPDLAGAVGLAAAAEFLTNANKREISLHIDTLVDECVARMRTVPGLRLYRSMQGGGGIISFTVEGIHPHDSAQVLADHNVAVRAGHHCCQPLMHSLGLDATVRASFSAYNQQQDIDALMVGIEQACELFH